MLATDLSGLVRASGRSWWEARYAGGRVVTEWGLDAGPGFLPRLVEAGYWDQLSHASVVGVRLLCPDGSVAELAGKSGSRLFQFKAGGMAATGGGQVQWCAAHVIGAVLDPSGNCVCRAWETVERRVLAFEDNVFDMRYRAIGQLALEHLGIRI